MGDSLVMGNGVTIPADACTEVLREQVSESGNAKTTLVGGEAPTVGALARLNLGLDLLPLSAAAFEKTRSRLSGADMWANNLVRQSN